MRNEVREVLLTGWLPAAINALMAVGAAVRQDAESRPEKRWMQQQNEKSTREKKKQEATRVRRLVDLAYKLDPRIIQVIHTYACI